MPMGTIELIDINAALKDLWEEAKAENKIKACLFNLVIYTQTDHRARYMRNLVDKIIETFPCRIIHLEADPHNSEETLKISVEAKTSEKGRLNIICDQIQLFASGPALFRVPSLILPHLVPDLPTFLLWGEDPTEDLLILPSIQQYATRLIFDSEGTADLDSFTKTILKEIDNFPMDFVDLNWARIACWRQVVAQGFDTEDKVQCLFQMKEVDCTYSVRDDGQYIQSLNQSLYLQAWLASRLGWEFVSMTGEGEQRLTRYRSRNHEVVFRLTARHDTRISSGTIVSLHFRGEDTEAFIDRVEDHPTVRLRLSTQEKCDLPILMPLPSLLKGRGFMKEVFYSQTSQHYRLMLEELQHLPLSTRSS